MDNKEDKRLFRDKVLNATKIETEIEKIDADEHTPKMEYAVKLMRSEKAICYTTSLDDARAIASFAHAAGIMAGLSMLSFVECAKDGADAGQDNANKE